MVTVGHGLLDPAVRAWFDSLVTYDVEQASKQLADDATFQSPWTEGTLEGKEAITGFLEEWLTTPGKRPSFSMVDIDGDGTVVRITFTTSGQGGRRPKKHTMHMLVLKHRLHQIRIRPMAA